VYDATVTNYEAILDYFFRIHDPTTVDRQGNDRGSSYRSAIFFQNEDEKKAAEDFIKVVNDSERWPNEVVTTLEPFTQFWPAEPEHQDYLLRIPNGYTCHFERFGAYEKTAK
ncbi:MAG: peptide-methionine (S)-S-oxide reductase, partial [Cryomorphaceae bacterium]